MCVVEKGASTLSIATTRGVATTPITSNTAEGKRKPPVATSGVR